MIPEPDQPQSSRTPTPLLRRRGYLTVPTTRRAGREWTQRDSPVPAWSSSTVQGTDHSRRATALGDVAWAAAGVLEPQGASFGTVALWDPSRCQCLSVVRS